MAWCLLSSGATLLCSNPLSVLYFLRAWPRVYMLSTSLHRECICIILICYCCSQVIETCHLECSWCCVVIPTVPFRFVGRHVPLICIRTAANKISSVCQQTGIVLNIEHLNIGTVIRGFQRHWGFCGFQSSAGRKLDWFVPGMFHFAPASGILKSYNAFFFSKNICRQCLWNILFEC